MSDAKALPAADEPVEPDDAPATAEGDFPIDIQAMMEDYESQIGQQSRQIMLLRMKLRSVTKEMEQMKEVVTSIQQGMQSGPRPLRSAGNKPRKTAQKAKK